MTNEPKPEPTAAGCALALTALALTFLLGGLSYRFLIAH